MKIKELIYQSPKMSEEKLLELIDKHKGWLKKDFINRMEELYGYEKPFNQMILDEYDLIQDKKSLLTRSQRDIVIGFVGTCMIIMTKGEDIEDDDGNITGERSGDNSLEDIQEIEEVRND